MAANTSPVFPAGPQSGTAHLTAANTARDGTGTLVNLLGAGSNGARVDRVAIKPVGTTHANVVRFFLNDGDSSYLLNEVIIAPAVLAATAPSKGVEWVRADGEPIVLLGPGCTLQVSEHVADVIDVVAYGGQY